MANLAVKDQAGATKYVKASGAGTDADAHVIEHSVEEFPAAAALADAAANPTTTKVGAELELYNGTTWDRVRGDTTNGLDADVTRMPTGASAAQVQGTVAHDGAAAQNPVRIAGKANLNEPAAVADGDVVDAWMDQQGRRVVVDGHPNPETPATATLTLTTDAAIIAAPGASLSLYITHIAASNTSATKSRLDLKDGATTRISMMCAADGGGFVWQGKPWWKLAANAALNGALGTAVTDVRVNVQYFIAA